MDDMRGAGPGAGAGAVAGAESGSPDFDFELRAERGGSGAGRVYTVTYRATDAAGNSGQAAAIVTVPHDASGGPR
jgi:pectinesterase